MDKFWHNYASEGIAEKQRGLVDKQLKDMHDGNAPGVFAAIHPALQYIYKNKQ